MKVLVPVDGSERSMKAVEMAVELAEKEGAEVTLLAVARYLAKEFYEPETLPADAQAKLDSHALGILKKARARFEQKGIDVKTLLDYGMNPGNKIVEVAEAGGFDHIIIGSTGASGLTRLLLGGTATKVVQHAPCTVTIVR